MINPVVGKKYRHSSFSDTSEYEVLKVTADVVIIGWYSVRDVGYNISKIPIENFKKNYHLPKVTKWANLYKKSNGEFELNSGGLFDTEEDAKKFLCSRSQTIKIEIEE